MRSYTVTLTSSQADTLPQVLDHYRFLDPITRTDYIFPNTADGSLFNSTTGTFVYPFTADDELFTPWGYDIQDINTAINIGPLKGPYTVTFSPTGLSDEFFPVSKIVYDFGDGEKRIVSRSFSESSKPNAVNVAYDYYPKSADTVSIYNPTITVYNTNLTRNIFNITISAVPLSIYDLGDVHLINSVQRREKAELQNIFEIKEPNYLTVNRIVSTGDAAARSYPFNPNISLPDYKFNLIMWLDAADGPTLQKNSNSNVLRWVDKSSYYNDVSAGSVPPFFATERGTKSGRRAVCVGHGSTLFAPGNPAFDSIFYGPNDFFEDYGYTIFFVGKLNTVDGTLFSYDINDVSNSLIPNLNISFDESNTLTVQQGNIPGDTESVYQPTVVSNISKNLSAYSLFSVTLSSNNNSWYDGIDGEGAINADAIITADTLVVRKTNQNYKFNINQDYYYSNVLSFLQIGASNAYPDRNLRDAEISELLVFNAPLDDQSRKTVSDYLINKWNLTLKTN